MAGTRRIAVTGGGGYVGSALVPYLVGRGYDVTVVDLFMYGEDVFPGVRDPGRLHRVRADVRDEAALKQALDGAECVIHLACISNDPSFELDPALGRSINYDAFFGLLQAVRSAGVGRLVYASSSSVYGVRSEPDVREDTPCTPLTDYSKYKLLCEEALRADDPPCDWVILRPATVCGYAPRMRLDLTVNILTINALARKEIVVFGGAQLRPNLNVKDMVAAYATMLEAPRERIHGETFNVGYENHSVARIAEIVRDAVGDPHVTIRTEPTPDHRSYHVNSDKIAARLGFRPTHTLHDAVTSICEAYRAGLLANALDDPRFYNIRTMQRLGLK